MLIEYRPELIRGRGALPPATNILMFPALVVGEGKEAIALPEIRLTPGVNSIPKAQWDGLQKHPPFAMALRYYQDQPGVLTVRQPPAGQNPDADLSIKSFTIPDAVQLIQDTNDVKLLQAWQDEDDRKGVQRAIAEQLEKLTPKPKAASKADT